MAKGGRFLMQESRSGYWSWDLYASNNKIILSSSHALPSKWSAIWDIFKIKWVSIRRRNFMVDSVRNATSRRLTWWFSLENGISEEYLSKQGMENGIDSVQYHAPFAIIQTKQ